MLIRSARLLPAVFLLFALLAWGIEPKSEFYVINVKPPSISVVTTSDMKVASEIELPSEPSYALMGPDNKYLYVLLDGLFRAGGTLKPGQSKLAIIDVESRKLEKTLPLAWNTRGMSLSKNDRYLLCMNAGPVALAGTPSGRSFAALMIARKKGLQEENGSVTIIDTKINEPAATLPAGSGFQAAYNSDLSRIAILSQGEPARKKGEKPTKPRVTIFSIEQQEKPLAEIELERAKSISLSSDEKYLYVLDQGMPSKKPEQYKNGVISVIDLAEFKVVKTHEVATSPKGLTIDPETNSAYVLSQASVKDNTGKFFHFSGPDLVQSSDVGVNPLFVRNFGAQRGAFIITGSDVRVLPPGGSVSTSFVALNPRKGAAAPAGAKSDTAAADKYLGGIPGEVLYLPQQNKMVTTVLDALGAPTSKVAILDIERYKVQSMVTTGRGSVKFAKFMGDMALSVAMSSLSYYGGYLSAIHTGSPFFYYNVFVFTPAPPNLELASSPDGKFVYALNTQTNDVTVIDVNEGKVLEKIAVGGSCSRIALAPGGKFVYSYTPKQFDLIDVSTNKKHEEYKVSSGKIHALYMQEAEKRIMVLTSDSVLVWDAEKGDLTDTVKGFHNPYMIVEPRHVGN